MASPRRYTSSRPPLVHRGWLPPLVETWVRAPDTHERAGIHLRLFLVVRLVVGDPATVGGKGGDRWEPGCSSSGLGVPPRRGAGASGGRGRPSRRRPAIAPSGVIARSPACRRRVGSSSVSGCARIDREAVQVIHRILESVDDRPAVGRPERAERRRGSAGELGEDLAIAVVEPDVPLRFGLTDARSTCRRARVWLGPGPWSGRAGWFGRRDRPRPPDA